ncbi:MAG: DUF3833 family protein [Caulobacteraceae bacterium]
MDARTRYAGELVFRPETFFLGRTEGAGIVRDLFGRVQRRCEIFTVGSNHDAYDAIHFDETFTYDDGQTEVWRWAMTVGPDGRYMAAEAVAGSGITGRRAGDDYILAFHRPVGPAKGLAAPRFSTRFTLLAPDLAFKQVRISLLGAPMGEMTAVHRRVPG